MALSRSSELSIWEIVETLGFDYLGLAVGIELVLKKSCAVENIGKNYGYSAQNSQ